MAEWLIVPPWKGGIRKFRIEGSNPSPSARTLQKSPISLEIGLFYSPSQPLSRSLRKPEFLGKTPALHRSKSSNLDRTSPRAPSTNPTALIMPTVRPVFHSSASFDLGAKNTGLFLVNHPAGAAPSAEYAAAYTIVQPADGDGLNYSTTNRRAVRHRLRGGKRFKLARRLVLQVIDALRKLKPGLIRDEEMRRTVEALSSLLKRRGFTRIESEAQVDPTTLDSVDPAVFADHETLGGFFSLGIPISTPFAKPRRR